MEKGRLEVGLKAVLLKLPVVKEEGVFSFLFLNSKLSLTLSLKQTIKMNYEKSEMKKEVHTKYKPSIFMESTHKVTLSNCYERLKR